MLFDSVLHRIILCSVLQIMDMKHILIKRASKVGYKIKFLLFVLISVSIVGDAYNIIIAVEMFIFLCVARMLPCKKQDASELSKPRKRQKVENMEAECYPGQLCVIFGICFQLQCIVLSGCLAAPPIQFSGGSLIPRFDT